MTEFWDKPAEKSGKVLAAFLKGLPLVYTIHYTVLIIAHDIFYCHCVMYAKEVHCAFCLVSRNIRVGEF
jgi:hypothetical protein